MTLVTTLLLPLLVLAAPRSARAQVTGLPSVAILDFGVNAGARVSGIQTRNATDAVWMELSRAGGYDITPRATVNEELQKLELSLPLDVGGIQRLGQSLGVKYILTGDIADVKFTDAPRRARVALNVRLSDVASGEFVNGAVQIGLSPVPKEGNRPDDETLIGQAITNAAFNAVKQIRDYTLPEATVLTNRGNTEVRLNRGSRDGITPGLEMIALRSGERVGRVRVTTVQSTDSEATIIDTGKGIRPQDKLLAVFHVAGTEIKSDGQIVTTAVAAEDKLRPKKNGKGLLQTVIGIGAAIALGAFVSRTTSSNNGAGIVGVQARAYAEGSIIASNDPTAARVEIRWKPAQDIPFNNIIEFHIYRDDEIIGVTARNEMRFVDSPNRIGTVFYNRIVYSGGGFVPGTTTGTNNNAGNNNNGGIGGNNGGTGTNNGTGNNGTGNGTGTGTDPSQQDTLATASSPVTGLTVGISHRYRVSVLYKQVQAASLNNTGNNGGGGLGNNGGGGLGNGGGGLGNNGGGGLGNGGGGLGNNGGGTGNNGGTGNTGTTILYRESAVEASSGSVTPIARPGVTGPVADQDLRKVTVTFRTVQGANEYVTEFSATPDFKRKVTRPPFIAPFTSAGDTRTELYDISTEFQSLRGGDRIYYRVGARNSIDTPGPIGLNTPNADNFVYSQDGAYFAKLPVPPGPPTP